MKSLARNLETALVCAGLVGALALGSTLVGCSTASGSTSQTSSAASSMATAPADRMQGPAGMESTSQVDATKTDGTILDATDLFTNRDLKQEADTSSATTYTLSDNQNIAITEEGVYVISGSAENVTITVEASDDAKVQIVLDGATITNESAPAIYVKSADKVFVTTSADSTLSTTGTFVADGDTNLDAVIFSRSDLTFNGTATLTLNSTDNAIASKDGVKVTGGTYNISCESDAIEAHDFIAVCDGTINVTSANNGLKAKDSDDDTVGYIYISGGTFNIDAENDAIHATTALQIDGGTFSLTGAECLEATYIQINDGTIDIQATDDGINAAQKSTSYSVVVDIRGGDTTVVMGSGDTDGIDSNGSIYISGGTVNVTCNSPFDYDQTGEITGGTVITNGEQVTEMTNQMMGGGMGGGMQGGQKMPGAGNQQNQQAPQNGNMGGKMR